MVTLNDARRVIAAAEKKAAEIGQPMNIAVTDSRGQLGCAREDGRSLDWQHRYFDQEGFHIPLRNMVLPCSF